MEEKRSKQVNLFFLGVVVVCTIFLAAAFLFGISKSKKGSTIINQIQNSIENVVKPTNETYKESVNQIFSVYFGKLSNIENLNETEKIASWLTLAEQTKNNLLSVKVTADFKDKHLAIILSLDKIENFLTNRNIEGAKKEENNLLDISKL